MKTLACSLALAVVVASPCFAQFELRLGAQSVSAHRNTAQAALAGASEDHLTGAEFLIRGGNVGLEINYYEGDFGNLTVPVASSQLRYADARLLLGSRSFSIDLGYGRRAESESFDKNFAQFAIGGARSTIRIGASGLSLSLGAAVFVEIDDSKEQVAQLFGGEIESQARYALPRGIPAYVMVGFRFSRFTLDETAGDRHEELTGLMIGGGFRLGRR